MKRLYLLSIVFVLAACTVTKVTPLDPSLRVRKVCIEDNPKVIVPDFLDIIRDGFSRHGIATEVYSGEMPEGCDGKLTYTALRSWDLAPFLSYAELRLYRDGAQIAYGEFHLRGKGGYALTKYKSTRAKMDPVIDELLRSY